MFSDHRENIATDLKDWFDNVKASTSPEDTKGYPVDIATVLANATDPVNVAQKHKLPAVFFKYGQSRPNPNIKKPVNHRGETIDYAIFTVIGKNDKTGEGLFTRSAKMHSLIEMLVQGEQYIGNRSGSKYKTREVRLGPSRAFGFRRLAGRGFIEFHIEIDHIYPQMETGKTEYEVKKSVEKLKEYIEERLKRAKTTSDPSLEQPTLEESKFIAKQLFPLYSGIIDEIYKQQ